MSVLTDKLLPALDFFVHDSLDVDALVGRPRFADHDRSGVDDLLTATADVARRTRGPALRWTYAPQSKCGDRAADQIVCSMNACSPG